jgi:hypothetical protein
MLPERHAQYRRAGSAVAKDVQDARFHRFQPWFEEAAIATFPA